MADSKRHCELCKDEASFYCPSDSAFLCCSCDAKVHRANFLVARHVRSSICLHCRNFTGYRFSGAMISPLVRRLCLSCSPPKDNLVGDVDSGYSICCQCRNFNRYRFSGSDISPTVLRLCLSCLPPVENITGDVDFRSSSSCSSSCVSSTVERRRERGSGERTEKAFAPLVAAAAERDLMKVEGVSVCSSIPSRRQNFTGIFSPMQNHAGDIDSGSSSSSTFCMSSTAERKRLERGTGERREKDFAPPALEKDLMKVEGVILRWCRMMGLDLEEVHQMVPKAVELLDGCSDGTTFLPYKVLLASSFWVGLKLCWSVGPTCQDLRRVEQISGVPAKLILATESRLARAIKRRQSREYHEEGWAESC